MTNRHLSCTLLENLAAQSEFPWLCMGDFNEILYSHDKKGEMRKRSGK